MHYLTTEADNLSHINSREIILKDTIALVPEQCSFYVALNSFIQFVGLPGSFLFLVLWKTEQKGLAGHIICLLGVLGCFRKLFLSISLALHVNNPPYLLPLKFSRVWGGARRICPGCWTKLWPKHAAVTKRSIWVSVNCVIGKSLHIPTCCTALPTNVSFLSLPCKSRNQRVILVPKQEKTVWHQQECTQQSLQHSCSATKDLDTPHWKKWGMCITSEISLTLWTCSLW